MSHFGFSFPSQNYWNTTIQDQKYSTLAKLDNGSPIAVDKGMKIPIRHHFTVPEIAITPAQKK